MWAAAAYLRSEYDGWKEQKEIVRPEKKKNAWQYIGRIRWNQRRRDSSVWPERVGVRRGGCFGKIAVAARNRFAIVARRMQCRQTAMRKRGRERACAGKSN